MDDTIPPRDSAGNPLTAYIYALIDPETKAIRYIGKTTTSLRERLTNHLCEKKDDRKTRWIKSLKRRNIKPLIQLIEEIPIAEWRRRECYWIAYYRAQGYDLTNTALGGQGGEGHSPETKAKLAAANLGLDRGPEFRAKMKEVMLPKKGIKRPPEVGAKVSATKKGQKRPPFSEEWRRNLGNAQRGRKYSAQARENISLAMKKSHAMKKLPPPDAPTLWS